MADDNDEDFSFDSQDSDYKEFAEEYDKKPVKVSETTESKKPDAQKIDINDKDYEKFYFERPIDPNKP